MEENKYIVQMKGIVKDFPGVRALDNVDFDLCRGEIHALVGENGAGKSTLSKILAGVLPLDRGTIRVNGTAVYITSPRKAQQLGISIVFQESYLPPYLTVAQSIFACHEPLRVGFVVNIGEEVSKARELLCSLSIDIDPNQLLASLSVGQQQLIAFARALSFNPRVLILDEPTSSLTSQEVQVIFNTLRRLTEQGTSIIYISHRLEEVFQISDRVTVLRDGKSIDTLDVKASRLNDVVRMMVGRDITEMYPKESTVIGEEALRLERVTCRGVCRDISLYVRKGEVVGLFGLVGAGRTETMRRVFGLDSIEDGSVYVCGKKISDLSPNKLVRLGVGFSPEDRKKEGLCLALPLKENILRASFDRLFPSRLVSGKREAKIAEKYIGLLNIATPSADRPVVYLSGGTQQKVVLAHWLCAGSQILILDEPTRGIDVGAKVEIYQIINQLAKNGTAVLLISSDLPEVIGICDRIYVMYRGQIVKEFKREEATAEKIVLHALGTEEAVDATQF